MKRRPIDRIELENVTLTFPNAKRPVFQNLSLALPMNQVVWLRGPSGGGKSALLKLLAGLAMPTVGQYKINDEIVSDMSFEEFVPYRCNMGYSFDQGGLINNRDVIGNLLLIFEYHDFALGSPGDFIKKISAFTKMFELEEVAKLRPSAIIGGQRKAACVARAFVHNPQVLLLDDPTTGLRGEVVTRLRDLLLSKKEDAESHHIFIASDDEEFMRSLKPIIIEVENGQAKLMQERQAA